MTDRHDPGPLDLEGALSPGPYLDDDGFTSRVVAALPPARPRQRARVLGAFASGAAALAAVLLAGPARPLAEAVATFGAAPWAGVAGAVALLGLAAAAVGAAAAEARG